MIVPPQLVFPGQNGHLAEDRDDVASEVFVVRAEAASGATGAASSSADVLTAKL